MFLVGSLVMFLVSLNHHRDGIITTYGSLDDKRNRATKKYIPYIIYICSVLVVKLVVSTVIYGNVRQKHAVHRLSRVLT